LTVTKRSLLEEMPGEEDDGVAGEQRRPLIINHDFDSSVHILHQNEDTISPLPFSHTETLPLPSLPAPNQRLASLDVFRGLTVAVCLHYFLHHFNYFMCMINSKAPLIQEKKISFYYFEYSFWFQWQLVTCIHLVISIIGI